MARELQAEREEIMPTTETEALNVLRTVLAINGSTRAILNQLHRERPDVIARLNLMFPDHTRPELAFIGRTGLEHRPVCRVCSNRVLFRGQIPGYPTTCSHKCARELERQDGSIKTRTAKIRETVLQHYGVTSPAKSEIVQNKIKETNLKRYGKTTFLMTPKMLEQNRIRSASPEHIAKSRAGLARHFYGSQDMKSAYQERAPEGITIHDVTSLTHTPGSRTGRIEFSCVCGNRTTMSTLGFRERMDKFSHVCTRCCPDINGSSAGEREVSSFLLSLGIAVENRKRIGEGIEIDLYLPEFSIGIEYTGLYWHSDAVKKDPGHLLHKQMICEGHHIRLLTIFEDEWKLSRNKVESVLRHLVGQSPKGVYARSTTIATIPWSEARPFLDLHHMLGAGKAGHSHLGAFHRDELIAVMSFGAPSDERGKTDLVEMKRFVTDGRNHPGLGSRMFKHALRAYGFTRVCAFVDRRWYTGSFKTISGFHQTGITPPALFYTDGHVRLHRRSYSKSELLDRTNDTTKTKDQLMRDLGYHRIYDCGKLRLEWSIPERS